MSYEFKVKIRRDSKKFLDRLNSKSRERIISKIRDFSGWLTGENVTVDVKSLKGKLDFVYR